MLPEAVKRTPLTLALIALPLTFAGSVSVSGIPAVVINNANYGAAGAAQSAFAVATPSVSIDYDLDPYEELRITISGVPAAIDAVTLKLTEHGICSPLQAFVEFSFTAPAEGSVGRPEFDCDARVDLDDELIELCSAAPCDHNTTDYRTPSASVAITERAMGSLKLTLYLRVDITKGPAVATEFTVSYAVIR
jgi:hypothetical protein